MTHTSLRDEAHHALYIEPSTAVAGPEGIFLAGAPAYDWEGTHVKAGAIFGIIVRPNGATHTIPWPLASHTNLADMRAALLPDGSWGVVFAELGPGEIIPRRAAYRQLWFGRFDGRAWHDLEALPAPGGAQLLTDQLSPLASRGRELAVSVPVTHPNTPPGAVVFTRTGGHWSASDIGVTGIAYTRLAATADETWDALVIRGDPGGTNVPYIYERYRADDHYAWRAVGSFAAERSFETQQPALLAADSALEMSWIRSPLSHVRGIAGQTQLISAVPAEAWTFLSLDAGRVVDLSARVDTRVLVAGVAGYSVALCPSGTAFYAVRSVNTAADQPSNELGELRLFRLRRGSVEDLGAVPTPYADVFAVAAASDTDVVLSGPRVDLGAGGRTSVVTELVRLRVHCSGSR